MRIETSDAMRIVYVCLILVPSGCFVASGLPETLDVVLPGGVVQPAAKDTGPALLDGGTWAAFRVAGDDDPPLNDPLPGPYGGLLNGGALRRPPAGDQIFLIDVAADGQATGIRENRYFLPRFYGETVIVRDEPQPATLPGVFFSSASYGVSVDDRFGIAVVVDVDFVGIPVGRATLYAWGRGDAQRVDGQFGYLLDFTEGIGGLILQTGGDQYPFFAERHE